MAHNATTLILEGVAGLNWLLGLLATLKSNVDSWFQGQINWLTGLGAISAGSLGIPGVDIVGLLGVVVAGASIISLTQRESAFDDMISAFTTKVQDLVAEMAFHPAWQNYEFFVGGGDGDWEHQQLSIFAHAPPS